MRRWVVVTAFLIVLTVQSYALYGAFSPQMPTDGWQPYGIAYVWPSDFSDLQGLRTRLQYIHSLGARTLIQNHNQNAPAAELRRFLDEADTLGMRVIVRLSGTTTDPPWGWDGENFDWGPLTTFLNSEGITGHPALMAIYGFHIPWDDFTADEIQRFYTEFHSIAPDVPLYHDLVWVEEPPHSDFRTGMCDLCEVSSMPHTWLDNVPVNNEYHVTDKMVRYTSRIRDIDPNAQIWIQAQTFQRTPSFRMPEASDMIWHANLLFEYVDFDGLLWYPYLHTYEYQLGDDGMEAQRQAVRTVYLTHFDWTPTNWTYLPFVVR
jgi:hypothetical protein